MRIVIADDSPLSRRLLEATLKGWGYQVVAACDGEEAWRILDSDEAPALAILDWMMPGLTGPEVCKLVREKAREPYTYILLLTSRNEKDDVVEGMTSGADDYITKPFDQHELKVRLRAGTRILELQLVATREALRIQATRDYLTQMWNRSSILEILDRELARSERQQRPVGVIVADLDHFKRINDTHGHFAGDMALREAASRMQASVRPYDSVGRYGGEEFLVVLPGCDEQDCRVQAERLRIAIHSAQVKLSDTVLTISASLGCTSGMGGQIAGELLIRVADDALYLAKRGGRNRTVSMAAAAVMQAAS
jgi:diguanylate cyclase (GGDEF)-like protein